jgi:hypothetical protein
LENKRAEQVLPGTGEVAQTMYTNVSKCKNDKIKEGLKLMKQRPKNTKNQ